MTPKQQARKEIDGDLLARIGWQLGDYSAAYVHTARGVTIREFELNPEHGEADNLLNIDGKAAGVSEAKKQGATLTSVECPSDRYTMGLPFSLRMLSKPLPFCVRIDGRRNGVYAWVRPTIVLAQCIRLSPRRQGRRLATRVPHVGARLPRQAAQRGYSRLSEHSCPCLSPTQGRRTLRPISLCPTTTLN